MRKINEFMEEINSLSNKLIFLENQFIECYKEFEGNEFTEQNTYSAEIENSVLFLTHEIGTHIGFEVNRLKLLIKFIDFRKKYKAFNDEELSEIITNFQILNISRKSELNQKGNIKEIVYCWNEIFNSKSYEQIKKQLKLDN